MQQVTALICIQCGRDFEFSRFDQIEFSAKGFDPPKRCPDCRKRKDRSAEIRFHRDKKKHYRMRYGV